LSTGTVADPAAMAASRHPDPLDGVRPAPADLPGATTASCVTSPSGSTSPVRSLGEGDRARPGRGWDAGQKGLVRQTGRA